MIPTQPLRCTAHDAEMYRDERDGRPMERWLCPAPGCMTIVSDVTLETLRNATGWEPSNARGN